jgi:hypothetical protein
MTCQPKSCPFAPRVRRTSLVVFGAESSLAARKRQRFPKASSCKCSLMQRADELAQWSEPLARSPIAPKPGVFTIASAALSRNVGACTDQQSGTQCNGDKRQGPIAGEDASTARAAHNAAAPRHQRPSVGADVLRLFNSPLPLTTAAIWRLLHSVAGFWYWEFDGRDVDKDVFPAALRLDESVSLLRIEPLHRAARHSTVSEVAWPA